MIEALVSAQQLGVTLLYGGRSLRPEYKALRNRPQIVIGTPGRTLDHLKQGTLKLDSVRFLVLDEADEMLDMGFAPDVQAIIGQTPSPRQTALMSATMPGLGGQDRREASPTAGKSRGGCRYDIAFHRGAPGLYNPEE